MKTPTELRNKLISAHTSCEAGRITVAAYKVIERDIVRELKAAHRRAYISGIRGCIVRQELLNHLRQLEEPQLYNDMYTDPLTGALNRRAFDRDNRLFVAIVDIDSLKYVNDEFGHRFGDYLLRSASYKLVEAFGCGSAYRLHGDEFAVRQCHAVELHHGLIETRRTFPCFSFGIGGDLQRADDKLKEDKKRRTLSAERAERGERPPWAQLVPAQFWPTLSTMD